jgi:multiple sugar transport system substrate-binding protein
VRRALLGLVSLLLLLPACGATVPPTPTPTPVEISFSYSDQALTGYYENAKKQFEAANPRFSVKLIASSPYAFFGSSGVDLDVAEINQVFLGMLAKAGSVRQLDPILQGPDGLDLSEFSPGTVDACRWHGQLYALPVGVDPQLLYYNKDLFDAANVPYPTNDWTWDDMLQAAQRISVPGAKPPLYGFVSEGGFRSFDFLDLVYQGGGSIMDSPVDPKSATLSSDASVAAIQWYVDLALSAKVMPNPQDLRGDGGLQTMVVSRRAAMWFGALSERNGLSWAVPWKFNWGAVRQPAGKQRISLFSLRSVALNQKSEHLQPAWLWAKFLAEHPGGDYDLPALSKAMQSDTVLAADSADVRAAARLSMDSAQALPSLAWLREFAREMEWSMTSIFNGDSTVRDAMSKADQDLNAILAKDQP